MSRETEIRHMEASGRQLLRQVSEIMRSTGKPCDLDDYGVRAEWSPMRAKLQGDRQYQMYVDAVFSLDGSTDGAQLESTALVASGRTRVDCLEMFFNWASDAAKDPNVLVVFRDKAKESYVETEARAAVVAVEAEKTADKVKTVREKTQEWLAKKANYKARKDGVIQPKVMSDLGGGKSA